MIRFEDIYDNAGKAFRNKEMFEFISGRNGYDCPVLDTPTSVPTDWTAIIPNGIYRLYQTEISSGEEIRNNFSDAVRRLIHGTDVELWEAAYVLFVQLKHEARGTAPFVLDEGIIDAFNRRVDERKDALSTNYDFDGKQFPNGLFGDIERLNHILDRKYSTELAKYANRKD